MTKFKKILVTGGYGFIGSALIRRLLEKSNNEVINIDKFSLISDDQSIIYILEKNISDEKQISELFDEIRRDLKNYELEARITELEAKFSKDFSENTFEELKELKKLKKIN